MDLVLSSGFLAFARHVGFLQAVEDERIEVSGLCGTSSGALVGSLWAAGLPARAIAEELSRRPPLAYLGWHLRLWRGLFVLEGMIERLRDLLPERVEDLPMPFAVGALGEAGEHVLLSSGPLPEVVAASCAIPYLFAPVRIGDRCWRDGGAVERTGLDAWRRLRGMDRPLLLHLVQRSGSGSDPEDLSGVQLVRTPRSGATFFSLGDFERQVEEARLRTRASLLARL